MAKLPDRYMEERRQEILDAARRVFVEKGYDNATMNDIAAAADVSAGSIYRYFENKRDLIAAASNACIEDDLRIWSTELPEGTTPGEAFLALGEQTRRDFADPGRLDECVLRLESYLACSRDPELRDQVLPMMEESVQQLAGFVRAAQESGEFDANIDPIQFARFLHVFGAGTGALSVLYGSEFDTDSVWNQLIALASLWFTEDFRASVLARMGEQAK
ncbi:MAG: TetR/AcrR family transcriptional regulator [Dehalococcoidia bacterium]|nr:TetR/AcrR family transcriptional regulator [Dehalococcoidia bacterium]MCA9856317.1 TetR/AcrR family transcriptional regulator [Dehalococcoidia bacterium]MCB9490582.1 TetR/AcrR family transcriptional regulator [Dehalococcoidia bacterium]